MEAMCVFDADTLRCVKCGYQAKRLPTHRRCGPAPIASRPPSLRSDFARRTPDWQPIMVGDLVEKALTSIGITQERVERLTRTAGKPGGCGCGARKKWLNERGVEVQKAIREAAKRVYGI